jgi:LuxR family maltose regulon positive regulatory protein
MDLNENTVLLSTKLKIPTPRKNYVIRKKLFEQLDASKEMNVIFIQGGAGTGKTTLVSSYIREKELDNATWLSLDFGVSGLYSFWLYFTSALCPFLEDGDQFLQFIKNADFRNLNQLIIMLINRIQTTQDYYIILDDVHTLTDQELLSSLELFLQSIPENLHIFMLSREEPPIYLGALAVSGRLLFIDSSQMYLSKEEGLDFLVHTLNIQESVEQLELLTNYAEGWIGGLQLIVAAKSQRGYSSELLKAGGGIATAYLNRELFEKLSFNEKNFLVKTSILAYFDYDLCTAVFPDMSHNEFQIMVESLIAQNLFIIILDEEKQIYRYHNILSEFLKQLYDQLPVEEKYKLRDQLANQLEYQKDYEEALRLYCDNKDFHSMMRIARFYNNSLETVTYLDLIPVDILVENAELTALSFMYNIWKMTDLDRTRSLYVKFKEHYADSALFHMLSYAEIFVSSNKHMLPLLNPVTVREIELLELSRTAKAIILIENAIALVDCMRYEEAQNSIRHSLQLIDPDNVYVECFALNQLAQIYEETGKLNDSLECYVKTKTIIKSSTSMLGMESNHYFGLLGVYMRRMELENSKHILAQCENILNAKHTGLQSEMALITLYFHQAEMHFLTGNNEKGKKETIKLIKNYSNYNILSFSRLLYELSCLDQLDDLLKERVLKEIKAETRVAIQPFYKILYARLVYQPGQRLEAMEKTEEVLLFSRKNNNYLRLVEAGILKIYILTNEAENQKTTREIHSMTLEVIHYAHENKILLPFYIDRVVMLPLLLELKTECRHTPKLMPPQEYQFLLETIALCSEKTSSSLNNRNLTQREIEILKELSLGITNREIADKLCISQATVKTHVMSIYSKLGVSSRLMAVEQAKNERIL